MTGNDKFAALVAAGVKLGQRACICGTCGELFTGETPFSEHRVGEFTHEPPDYGRRCLSPGEMEVKGMRRDGRGRWMQAEKALKRLPGGAGEPIATDPARREGGRP